MRKIGSRIWGDTEQLTGNFERQCEGCTFARSERGNPISYVIAANTNAESIDHDNVLHYHVQQTTGSYKIDCETVLKFRIAVLNH